MKSSQRIPLLIAAILLLLLSVAFYLSSIRQSEPSVSQSAIPTPDREEVGSKKEPSRQPAATHQNTARNPLAGIQKTARQETFVHVRPRAPQSLAPDGSVAPVSVPGSQRLTDPREIAIAALREKGINEGYKPDDFQYLSVTGQYVSKHNGVTHLNLRQNFQGIDVYNGDASANVAKDGTLLSLHNRFVKNLQGEINRTEPVITAAEAVHAAARDLGVAVIEPPKLKDRGEGPSQATTFEGGPISNDPIPAKLMYLPQPDATTRLVWNTVLHLKDGSRWMEVNIDAENGTTLSRANWYAHANYRVFALPFETPLDGARTLLTDPQDATTSPFGWHDTDGIAGAEFTDTRGNNVNAQDDTDANNTGGSRPDGGAFLSFDNPLDLLQEPGTYLDAATTNLFYWNNLLHDIHYQYGFDEDAGNFQEHNYGAGGLASDPVEADAQDGSGTNNANFGTPPDGSNPRMQMFIWTHASPPRDSDLDNVIIIHEYGHGVSNRLTGGPANSSALSANQSRGMGEGWSDWWGLALTAKPGQPSNLSRTVLYYVLDEPATGAGIRPSPYTTDMVVNDYTYGDIVSGLSVPHGIGFVWCSILWEVYWELVSFHGYDPDVYHGTGGNNIALQLVMDGLKLQPATPTYIEARDAIILADQVNNAGANKDRLWVAFAKRGLGFSATDSGDPNDLNVTEAFDLPDELFTIDDVIVSEGDAGTVDATFTVTLDPAAIEETTVEFAIANDSAIAPGDFLLASGTLIFDTDDFSKTITVTVNGDTTIEDDETFTVILSNAVNGLISDGEGVGTILTDDYTTPAIDSPLAASGIVGRSFSYQITAMNTPRSFSLPGAPPAGMTIDGNTGVISWTPSVVGLQNVMIAATNPAGTDTETLAIQVNDDPIKEAIDFDYPLTTGIPPWFSLATTTHDGVDAAQSGDIDDNESTYFEIVVTGPDTLRFWWKVSSEFGWDYLRLEDNGALVSEISGEEDWAFFFYAVPAGDHTIRWNYDKDGSVSSGSDAGWVDEVSLDSLDPRPFITSASSVVGFANQPFSHQITTANPATSFSSDPLPTGLMLNPSTGLISGTPTAVGTGQYQVTATNAAGSNAQSSSPLISETRAPLSSSRR
jgi:extracellular elastinolytic metalloproteinase